MKSSVAAPLRSNASDSTFNNLIDELTERLQAGEAVDIEVYVADHPEHADALRRLLPALQVLADLSNSREANGVAPPELSHMDSGTLGDFQIIREVGRGGMGIVYEAHQISLNRRVALKVLPFAATMDAKQLQRFRNEAMAAASLRHENIVHVYGVGCERSVHFYAMELIDGQSLAQIIAAVHHKPETPEATSAYQPTGAAAPTAPVGALSTQFSGIKGKELYRAAARIIADAADALEHAHSMGIVHRDIKPANLMVDADGKVYVTDFGLARYVSPPSQGGAGEGLGLTMSGDLLGTLRYMSPEQAMARHGLVDHRTDVYSLGATLYELLSGRPAVLGEDKQEVLKHIAFDDATPLRKIGKSIPAELETITLKALAKEPGERYATAKEFAEDLRRWREDKPIRAKPLGWRERALRWARRNKPAVWSGAVATLGLVAVTIVVLSISYYQIANERDAKVVALHEKEQARAAAQANFEKADYESQRAQRFFHRSRVAVSRLLGMMGRDQQEWREMPVTLRKKLTAEAVKYYEQFQKEVSDDPEIRFEAGWACWQVALMQSRFPNEIGDAERSYRKAIAILEPLTVEYPNIAKYWQNLGYSRRMLGKIIAAQQPEEAENQLRLSVIDYDTTSKVGAPPFVEWAAARNDLCRFLERRSRNLEAEQLSRETEKLMDSFIIKLPANSPKRNELAGVIGSFALEHLNGGRTAPAERCFLRAIELNPEDGRVLTNLGNLYCDLGRRSEAESTYLRAIEVTPEIFQPYLNLANLYRGTDRFAEALEIRRRAAQMARQKLGPANPEFDRMVGDEERLVAASDRLPQLLVGNTQPKNADEQLALALVFQSRDSHVLAAKCYAKAFGAEPALANEHYCFLAALSAFQVGFSRSKDSTNLSDAERTEWRQKTLEWIGVKIQSLANRVESKSERQLVRDMIANLESNVGFHELRSSKTNNSLPETERPAWNQLWADFAAVKKRVSDAPRDSGSQSPKS